MNHPENKVPPQSSRQEPVWELNCRAETDTAHKQNRASNSKRKIIMTVGEGVLQSAGLEMPAFSIIKLRVNLHATRLFLLFGHLLWENRKVRGADIFRALISLLTWDPCLWRASDSHKYCLHWAHSPSRRALPILGTMGQFKPWTLVAHVSQGHLCLTRTHLSYKVDQCEARMTQLKVWNWRKKKGVLRGFHFIPWGSSQEDYHCFQPVIPSMGHSSEGGEDPFSCSETAVGLLNVDLHYSCYTKHFLTLLRSSTAYQKTSATKYKGKKKKNNCLQ